MSHDPRLLFQRRDLPADLGVTLRAARERQALSRRDVSAAAGIAARTLARIERGAQMPVWTTLDALCDVLRLSVFAVAPIWAKASHDIPHHPGSAPGIVVRAIRKELKMTLLQLSEQSGVSLSTLSRFERGITASRILGRRSGGTDVSFGDRPVIFEHDGVASALGFRNSEHLRSALSDALKLISPPMDLGGANQR